MQFCKMWLSVYLASFVIGFGFCVPFNLTSGSDETERDVQCNVDRWLDCYKILPEEMNRDGEYPDEGLLDRSCPEVMKMTKCFEDYIKDCLHPGEMVFPFYAYNGRYFKEVCNKDSTVRANYIQHAECYRGLENTGKFKECRENASHEFQNYKDNGGYINPNVEDYFISCLKWVPAYICQSTEIAKTCGEDAYKAFFEMGKYTDSVKGIRFACSTVDFERELRTGFFSLFRISENERPIYTEVLDYLKEKLELELYKP